MLGSAGAAGSERGVRLAALAAELEARYSGDAAELEARYSGDAAELEARYSGDVGEELERHERGGGRRGAAARRGAERWAAELRVLSEALTGAQQREMQGVAGKVNGGEMEEISPASPPTSPPGAQWRLEAQAAARCARHEGAPLYLAYI